MPPSAPPPEVDDRTDRVPDRVERAAGRARRIRDGYLRRAPAVISAVAAVLGVFALIDGLIPRHWRLFDVFTPLLSANQRAAVDAITVLAGYLMLRIASGLRRRKRAEFRIALGVCSAFVLADVLRDERSPVQLGIAVALLAALVAARSCFTARSDVHSRWFAARIAAQLLLLGIGYGLVLLYLPHHVPRGTGFLDRGQEVMLALVGVAGPLPVRNDAYSDFFAATVLGFGLLTLAAVVLVAVRPTEPVARLDDADEHQLRALLARQGSRDSLGYFALRRDKAVVWSASGKAAITYRVVFGVALVSGDPIGDPEAWPGAIVAFRDLVERYGWIPAVMGCSELGATVFKREYGLAVLALGDEAVVEVGEFSLSGRSMRGVRQACTRIERAGYVAEVRRVRDLTPAQVTELRAAADAWRGEEVERGYSMALSRVGDPADDCCAVVTVRGEDGRLAGLLHFVPWGPDGLSLDLMRRDRNADNGLNEFMIAAIMTNASSLDVRRVSLNFAMFRDALERGDRIGAGPVSRGWRRLLLIASRWWQIDSLYRFNDKFRPQWVPRFVAYPAGRYLPRISLAALEAEAFIVRPARWKRVFGRV